MEFAMVLSCSCQFKAEHIFYGGVLATIRYKGIRMTDLQATILKSLSDNWEAIGLLADVIEKELRAKEAEEFNC